MSDDLQELQTPHTPVKPAIRTSDKRTFATFFIFRSVFYQFQTQRLSPFFDRRQARQVSVQSNDFFRDNPSCDAFFFTGYNIFSTFASRIATNIYATSDHRQTMRMGLLPRHRSRYGAFLCQSSPDSDGTSVAGHLHLPACLDVPHPVQRVGRGKRTTEVGPSQTVQTAATVRTSRRDKRMRETKQNK